MQRSYNSRCMYLHAARGVGRGGHWAMAPSLGDEGALCDCSAPSKRQCVYKENVVGGRLRAPSNVEKSLRKVPPCVYKENLVGECPQAPSNDEMPPPEKSLQ